MAWRRSYDFTPRVVENELDSSDDSDSEAGTENLKLYHRRKSTVTAVKARVSKVMLAKNYNRQEMLSSSRDSRQPVVALFLTDHSRNFQRQYIKTFKPRMFNF